MSNDFDPTTLRVSDFMTEAPATVDEGLPLSDAQERMYLNKIRHLCVMRENRVLVGLLSQRDIITTQALLGGELTELTVGDAMAQNPYIVLPDTPLMEVAEEMEAKRYGSAVVMTGLKPQGVFTTTDALRATRSLIAGRKLDALQPPEHLTDVPKVRAKVEHRTRVGDRVSGRAGVGPNPNQGTIR